MRINRASDDAAGLAIASTLNGDVRIATQAIRNLSDGISALSVAEGSLKNLSDITIRQRELAEQSANGVYSDKQRAAMQVESDKLVDEYNRIVASTQFNGQQLFPTGNGAVSFQLQGGSGSSGVYNLTIGSKLARATGDGTFSGSSSISAPTSPAWMSMIADINGDGVADLVTSDGGGQKLAIGNGDGTFKAATTIGSGGQQFIVSDLTGDGKLDLAVTNGTSGLNVKLNQGGGTFGSWISGFSSMGTFNNLVATDLNNDGIQDLVIGKFNDSTPVLALIGNGDGTFKIGGTFSAGTSPIKFGVGDFNGDGITDVIASSTPGTGAYLALGNGDGTFIAPKVFIDSGAGENVASGDLNGDGKLDFITGTLAGINLYLNNGDATFTKSVIRSNANGNTYSLNINDFNGDGRLDIIAGQSTAQNIDVLLGNGNGTFILNQVYGYTATNNITNNPELVDVNGDGALDLMGATGANLTFLTLYGNSSVTATVQKVNISTQSYAKQSLDILSAQFDRINQELGVIGASQSRLSYGVSVLQATRENYSAAASRILDADTAQDSADLIRTQIIQQAGLAVLAQANQQPALALTLLRG